MSNESPLADVAESIAKQAMAPPLRVARHASLLYEITVDNALEVMTPQQVRNPKRGKSAFETDLCVFEDKAPGVSIPRVVVEFKTKINTHSILTYCAKARKHKQIYPYLRYGILAFNETSVPGRVFTHNESLDFFASTGGLGNKSFRDFLKSLLVAEVEASRRLEELVFGGAKARLFRTPVTYE